MGMTFVVPGEGGSLANMMLALFCMCVGVSWFRNGHVWRGVASGDLGSLLASLSSQKADGCSSWTFLYQGAA